MENQRETFNDRPVYSLSEICKSLKSIINKNYTKAYYIKAEMIKLNRYPHSGHCFPELVEKEGDKIVTTFRAVIWKSQYEDINAKFLKITGEPISDNIKILCLATVEFSPQYGLALYIQDIEPTYTLGELMKNRLAVIAQLKKEGIFTANKEKKMPLLPKRIAVISVETSKGYSDFMVTLQQNNWNYCFETELFPSVLQGEKAIITITEQLEKIKKRLDSFDCVAIIRGGGGDVGMSCYDDYALASVVATFPIPVISGIGHSTNESVTDMVSYANKITPTEVAYFLIQHFHNFSIQVEEFKDRIYRSTLDILQQQKQNLEQLKIQQRLFSSKIIDQERSRLDSMQNIMQLFIKQFLLMNKEKIKTLEEKVALLHPDQVLKRGYSITYSNGKVLMSAKDAKPGDLLTTKFYGGELTSEVK